MDETHKTTLLLLSILQNKAITTINYYKTNTNISCGKYWIKKIPGYFKLSAKFMYSVDNCCQPEYIK